MTGYQLPGGGKAWFVRRKKGRHCDLLPASIEGHLLTGAFATWVSGISWFFSQRDVDAALIAAWIVLILAAALLFIVTALRMSASASGTGKGRR